jgi:hypothetical protein
VEISKLVVYTADNVTSYALMRLKTDYFNHYQNRDPRCPEHRIKTEAELRARIAPGGRDHKLVVEGGAWWRHVQWWLQEREARRAGDTERLEQLRAEQEAHTAEVTARVLAAFAHRP